MTQRKTRSRVHESACPLAQALNVIGDRWTVLVLRDILVWQKHRFAEFLESPEGISTNILSSRLQQLEDAGLIEKRRYQDRPARYAYHATASGEAFGSVLQALADWSQGSLGAGPPRGVTDPATDSA